MKRPIPPAVGVTEEAGKTLLHLGPYRLGNTLGQGGMGVVYRAERVDTGARVAVKTALDSSEMAVSSIRREIEILEQLDHPGVISLVDHGSVDGVPWLAMELLDGSTLLELLGQAASFDSRAQLAAPQTTGGAEAHHRPFDGPGPAEPDPVTSRPPQFDDVGRRFELDGLRPVLEVLRRLCHTLSYLHSEGVVHGDLKPSNVSLRVDATPVLVDFGVTALFEGGHSRDRILAHDSRLAGTLQYMAPEQLRGQFVDARADLYALGCMLYLVVTTKLPFRAASPEKIVSNHLDGEYRPPGELVDGLPDELDALIRRLLASEPDRRLGHADVVADTLGALLGVDEQAELERQRSRSHHLHKPAFVGQRELLEGLLGSLRNGDKLMLIGGRAGIGKTRLAREFAARAERTGMRVTLASADVGTAAADPTGHAPPLWAFRTTLRAVADRCRELGETETARVIGRRAAVLAQYEPALSGLTTGLGDAKLIDLPARAARTRVFTYLTETLVAFAAERPLLMIIDDLHLADELSLEFIADTLRSGGLDHVAIAATYRLEHRARVEPVLVHEDAQVFDVGALDDEAVASLVCDMLALSEPPKDFIEMIVAESGGNPFVVSEYVHAAVEQGLLGRGVDGSWEAEMRESNRVDNGQPLSASGRLESLIKGRLERLEAPERRIVEIAAVIGRRVGREELIELSGIDSDVAEAALERLIRRSLLEESDSAVRLVGQVGRVAYDRLAKADRRELHRYVARSLERRPSERLNLLHLVEQWRGAEVGARELCYLERAAEQALGHGAGATARSLLERGLELVGQLEQQGEALVIRRARLERLLAMTHRSAGEVEPAVALLEGSLANLGCPLPDAPLQWGMRGAWEFGRQIVHMAKLRPLEPLEAHERARYREVLETGLALIWPLTQRGQVHRAAVLSAMLANLADRLGEGHDYALPYAAIGEGCRYLKLDSLADFYLGRARDNLSDGLQRPVDFTSTIQVFVNDSAGRGDWQASESLLKRAIQSSEEAGDRIGWVTLTLTHAMVEVLRDRLGRAEALARRLETIADDNDYGMGRAWTRLLSTLIARQRGDPERAGALIGPLSERLEGHVDLMARGFTRSLQASVLAEVGQAGAALRVGTRAAEDFEAVTTGDLNFGIYHIYQCLPQAFLGCWQSDDLTDYERAGALAHLRRLVGRLENLAERFPAARAASLRNRGLLEAVDGRLGRASELLSSSLWEAGVLELSFEDRLTRRAAASLGSIRMIGGSK